MSDQEFQCLKDEIYQKMIELEALQKQHIHETGRRYVAPFYLTFADLETEKTA